MEPTDTASKSTSHGQKKTLYGSQGKIRSKGRLMFGGLVMVKEQDSEVAVVHRCFTDGGDSILAPLAMDSPVLPMKATEYSPVLCVQNDSPVSCSWISFSNLDEKKLRIRITVSTEVANAAQ